MRKQGKTREISEKHNIKTRRTAENNGKQRAWENREKHAKTGKHRKTRENTGKQGNKRKQEKTRGKSGKRRKTVENRGNLEKLKRI